MGLGPWSPGHSLCPNMWCPVALGLTPSCGRLGETRAGQGWFRDCAPGFSICKVAVKGGEKWGWACVGTVSPVLRPQNSSVDPQLFLARREGEEVSGDPTKRKCRV